MIIRRTSFEPGAPNGAGRQRRAGGDDGDEANFRGRAEQLLEEANSVKDVTARTELVIRAAILHHLALLREAGREIASLPLRESPSFAKSRVDAQLLGQDGEKRGLRGGAPNLERARDAYDTIAAAPETRHRPASRREV